MQGKNAFTLIEMSIVLVVIGLVISGILLGQTLINSYQMRATMAQVEQFKTASNTFKLKYNCLAGDCSNASSLLTGASNGNGNNKIDGASEVLANEYFYFWQHLSLSGFIPGAYTSTPPGPVYGSGVNFPASKYGNGFSSWNSYNGGGFGALSLRAYEGGGAFSVTGLLFPAKYGNSLMLGSPWVDLTSNIPIMNLFPGRDARAIDSKFDDGLPGGGAIMSWANSSEFGGECASTDDPKTAVYLDTTGFNTFDARCVLLFPNAF
jgi:prepilin-type N-terminal cleavage/methylation domain-containing protein